MRKANIQDTLVIRKSTHEMAFTRTLSYSGASNLNVMMNYATTRMDWQEADDGGASLVRGTAWAVTFSLPLWGAMIWACLKLF
jgi:hypothetical protein